MQKLFVGLLFLISTLYCEPSAFGAGDLSSDEPYGLTDSEKYIKKNNDSVKQLKRDRNMINSDLDQLKTSVDGLRSLMQGLTKNKQQSQQLIKKILITQDDLEVASLEYKEHFKRTDANISDLTFKLNSLVTAQNENYEKIKKSFVQFDDTLKVIEKNYVSKKSFDALQKELNDLKALIAKKFNTKVAAQNATPKSGAELFKEGKAALKAKHYKTAATRFMDSIKKNYKPATSHFYTGEAYFYQKRYKKAISYYKESYKRYKKASYSAKLFLHMGESLYNSGDKKKAIKVFKQVVKQYPGTRYAKSAQKYIKNQ